MNTVDYNSYLINEEKQDRSVWRWKAGSFFSSDVSPQILNLAEETGLSTLTIQKIFKS